MTPFLVTLLLLIYNSNCEYIVCNGNCNCHSGEHLGITCRLDCTKEHGCMDGTVTCRTGDPCIIDCRGLDVCGGNTNIDASQASDVTVYCGPKNGCKGNVNIICGIGDCTINCDGTNSCQGAEFIANRAHSYQCIGQCNTAIQAQPPYTATPTKIPTAPTTKQPTPSPTNNPTPSPTHNPTPSPTELYLEPLSTNNPTTTSSATESLKPTLTASLKPYISNITTSTPTTAPMINSIVFQNITRVIDVYGEEEEDEQQQEKKNINGLSILAIVLSAAFFCIFCVSIPAFVWDTKRKSNLMEEIKGEDIQQRVDGVYTLANNNNHSYYIKGNNTGNDNDDDDDSIDDIYDKGVGPPPVTSAMLTFLKEKNDEKVVRDLEVEDDEKMEEIKVVNKTPRFDDKTLVNNDTETDDDESSIDIEMVHNTSNIDMTE